MTNGLVKVAGRAKVWRLYMAASVLNVEAGSREARRRPFRHAPIRRSIPEPSGPPSTVSVSVRIAMMAP